MYSAHLLTLVEQYCAATGLSEARVATLVRNYGGFFKRVRDGGAFTNRTYERVLQWFSDNWPAGEAWPEAVARPAPRGQMRLQAAVETNDQL